MPVREIHFPHPVVPPARTRHAGGDTLTRVTRSNSPRPKRIRAVIAESHILLRDLLIEFLSTETPSFELVGTATTLESALRLCHRFRADLLVLRYALLGSRGELALLGVREKLPRLRILQYSGSQATEEQIAKALRSGTGFVSKEITSREFLQAIDRIIRGQKHFCDESTRILAQMATGLPSPAGAEKKLSAREIEVLRLIADGRTSKQIANLLGLSAATIDTHRRNMMAKIRAHNAADLIRYGHEQQLFEAE